MVTKFRDIIRVRVMVEVRFRVLTLSHFFLGYFLCKRSIPGVLNLLGFADSAVTCTSYTLNKSRLHIQNELNLITK